MSERLKDGRRKAREKWRSGGKEGEKGKRKEERNDIGRRKATEK